MLLFREYNFNCCALFLDILDIKGAMLIQSLKLNNTSLFFTFIFIKM